MNKIFFETFKIAIIFTLGVITVLNIFSIETFAKQYSFGVDSESDIFFISSKQQNYNIMDKVAAVAFNEKVVSTSIVNSIDLHKYRLSNDRVYLKQEIVGKLVYQSAKVGKLLKYSKTVYGLIFIYIAPLFGLYLFEFGIVDHLKNRLKFFKSQYFGS